MVITMLADDAAVESAVFARDGVLEALSPSTIRKEKDISIGRLWPSLPRKRRGSALLPSSR
jgi:hypothetical protein